MHYFLDMGLLFRNRDLGLLYAGQFISFMGTMISYVVLPYQIYQMTQSTIMVGLLSLVQLIPILFTALIGGVLADRWNRRGLLLISESLLSIGCALLAFNASLEQPTLWGIYLIAFLMAAINGLHRPALDSITQQIVDAKDYKKVGALASFKYSFGMIVGPAIAGFIIASHGLVITYLLDLGTFVISVWCLFFIHKIPKPEAEEHSSVLKSLTEGLKFATQKQELMGSYLVDILAMVFAMPNVLFPAIALQFGGAQALGLLYAAPAVGSLLISFISGWTAHINYDGRAIAIAAMLWGLSIAGFGLTNHFYLALFFLMLSGVFDTVSGIFRSSLWNNCIPYKLRGRLSGIEMISYLSGPKLGDTRAGFMAAFIGLQPTLYIGGFCCIAAVAVVCAFYPGFWNYQHHSEK